MNRRAAALPFLLAAALAARRPELRAAPVGAVALTRAQDPAAAVDTLVARAGRYVEAYEKAFSAIVCEERQTQRLVRPNGKVEKHRDLISDFLLVKVGAERLMAFRDVLQVDGRSVRNRQERLRKLFIDNPRTAVEQAQAISEESGRFNIGPSRTINSPLLPLQVLNPRVAPGFRFALAPGGLAFEEFHSPSLIRHKTGGAIEDLPSRGSCVVDSETGRVSSVSLTAGAGVKAGATGDEAALTGYAAAFEVRYVEDTAVALLVPVELKEEYWQPRKPEDGRLVASSTYSNFRRFQVTTKEEIKIPKERAPAR